MLGLALSDTLLTLHILVSLGLGLRLIWRRMAINATLAWLVVVASLPALGLVLYWLFGSQRLSQKRLELGSRVRDHYLQAYKLKDEVIDPAEIDTKPHVNDLARAVEALVGFAPVEGNKIELLVTDTLIFDAMVRDIDAARETVFAEFYIVHPAGMPLEVLRALARAAERGCDVKLLADAIGARPFFKSEWPARLRAAGVDIETSLDVGLVKSFSKRTDMRNHRKILVLDQETAYVGSCNLTDPEKFKPRHGHWVDLMARVEGPAAESLSAVLAADFIFDRYGDDFTRSDLDLFPTETAHPEREGPMVAQVAPSGPEMAENVIYEALLTAIFGARQRIRIATPYFVPDEALTLALCNAVRRGVDVELIMPAKGDSVMVRYASSASFETLLDAGVRIARFRAGMLHTKALVIDDDLSIVGTVNMDQRSLHLNLEVSLVVYDEGFNGQLSQLLDDYLEVSLFMDAADWRARTRWQRFKENVFRLVSPLL